MTRQAPQGLQGWNLAAFSSIFSTASFHLRTFLLLSLSLSICLSLHHLTTFTSFHIFQAFFLFCLPGLPWLPFFSFLCLAILTHLYSLLLIIFFSALFIFFSFPSKVSEFVVDVSLHPSLVQLLSLLSFPSFFQHQLSFQYLFLFIQITKVHKHVINSHKTHQHSHLNANSCTGRFVTYGTLHLQKSPTKAKYMEFSTNKKTPTGCKDYGERILCKRNYVISYYTTPCYCHVQDNFVECTPISGTHLNYSKWNKILNYFSFTEQMPPLNSN